jgi:hypothetical protein
MHHFLFKVTHTLLNVASEVTNHGNSSIPFGILVVGIIQAPVLILLLATLLGKPRQPKITGVFIGFIAMMVI